MSAADRGDPERWAERDGVRLHYLDSTDRADPGITPMVFLPGFGEEALDHVDLIELLLPRRVVVPDLRGRGPSDAPVAGYTLADHVGDLDAVIGAAGLDVVHVASYSRGTAYALRWALDHPDRVRSVAVGDYTAAHLVPPPGTVDIFVGQRRGGRPVTDRISATTMAAVFADAVAEDYHDRLARLPAPLLVVRGGRRSSLLSDEALARYRSARPDVVVEVLDDSGHDLWSPDPAAFPRLLARFAERADGSAQSSGTAASDSRWRDP